MRRRSSAKQSTGSSIYLSVLLWGARTSLPITRLSLSLFAKMAPSKGESRVLLAFLATLCTSFITVSCNTDAKRLYDDLMSSYNSLIRPVGNVSDRLIVKMGVKLSQLVDVVSIICLLIQRIQFAN